MKVVLKQAFPLGRFHATPWKVFPYDDPHGEWPPSPWRLLRALLARSYQLERETEMVDNSSRELLVAAFAASRMSWQLPVYSWRGPGFRQYQPAEFKKMPAAAKEPGMFTYNTTKVQDNFWLTAGGTQPLYWIFEGNDWNGRTLSLLDQCLERMTYFGRAESITEIERINDNALPDEPNCPLSDRRTADSVPVLCPHPNVTLDQLRLTTDDKDLRNSTVPPGAVWKFAQRPPRLAARSQRKMDPRKQHSTSLLQFALGGRVAPNLDHIALITNWFRGRAVRFFLEHECGVDQGNWQNAGNFEKEAVSLLSGKGADNKKLLNHEHAYFGLYLDHETKKPTRLLAWRKTPFTPSEESAIRHAASIPFSLGHRESSNKGQASGKRDPWKVHCVPLDSVVPPPPGFDPNAKFSEWESLTPYVPPRHAFDSRGKPRTGEDPIQQLRQELERLDVRVQKVIQLNRGNELGREGQAQEGEWLKVHQPKSQSAATNQSKLGYRFRLIFLEPVPGPIALGHSCHFGLGLFVPVD